MTARCGSVTLERRVTRLPTAAARTPKAGPALHTVGAIPDQTNGPGGRIVGTVLYNVTVEPADRQADPDIRPVSATIEADDKDAALNFAETSYRKRYPRVGKLRSSIVRRHPGGKPHPDRAPDQLGP